MNGPRIAARAGALLLGMGLLAGCGGAEQPTGVGSEAAASTTAATTAPAAPSEAPAPVPPAADPGAPPPAGGGEPERPPGTPDGDPRCAPAQLEGRMEPGDSGAGHRSATLVVTNTSTNTCTLYGYGGAELYTASGVPIPTRLTRAIEPGPSLVRLLPGSGARKDLRWTVVATGDEPVDEPCQVPASQLRVIPPDETSPFSVIWDLGPVCDGGRLDDSAFYAP